MLDQVRRCGCRIVYMQREPNRPGRPTTDLDAIERLRLLWIEELEGRPAGVEDRPPAVGPDPRFDLRQAEGVAVERDRAVVVIDGQGNSELANDWHGPTVANADLRKTWRHDE
jgi:hypothetical protein